MLKGARMGIFARVFSLCLYLYNPERYGVVVIDPLLVRSFFKDFKSNGLITF